jgi:hypothetical protein
VGRCALICLETLTRRRSVACMLFVFDVLSGRVSSPNLLSLVNVIASCYLTRAGNFLRIDFYRTNYGVLELLIDVVRHFNKFAGLIDIHTYIRISMTHDGPLLFRCIDLLTLRVTLTLYF